MKKPEPGEIIWFLNPDYGVTKPLAFIRDHRNGAYVFGGHTGSHYTAHDESWEEKLNLILRKGYCSIDNEQFLDIVKSWSPPQEKVDKDPIVQMIRSGKL